MMFLNLGLLGLLLQPFGLSLFMRNELPKKELVIVMISLFAVNYFLFIHKDNYKSIIKELKKESKEKRRTNTFFLWLYFILSFALFAFGAILLGKLNR